MRLPRLPWRGRAAARPQADGTGESDWLAGFRQRAFADIAEGVRLPAPDGADEAPLTPRALPRRIWIYWAQGWDAAPVQSRLCLASWRRHNPGWTLVPLDDATIGAHADLGTLLDGKTITVTGRSNLLRMALLAEHGGVWVDASTYCARPLDAWLPPLMQSGFFAFARPGSDRALSTWFLAAEPGHPIVLAWRALLERYWRRVDAADFYHWTHYLFSEACRSDPGVNRLWHRTPWISADGPHQVQNRADAEGAEEVRISLAERRVPVHKLETRRPTLPEPGTPTPLAWLLYGAGRALAPHACEHPRASVVMTVYRDLRFLDAAVESVLNQDLDDIELIIVDDGNDDTAPFDALAARDPRIRILANPTNMGTAAAANRGIAAARADIIVRLDADDLAEPARIGALVAALDADPGLGLVGSAVTFIDEIGAVTGGQAMPETDLDIRWTILFHNPFFHSAVAFRRNLFEAAGRYRAHELISQDHYLWFDMLPLCQARNLKAPLTRYRWNAQGLTLTNAGENPRRRTHAIRQALWAGLGLAYDLHDDALAGDISGFLRGHEIPPERRFPAYRAMLTVLTAFLAGPAPAANEENARNALRLVFQLAARMRSAPPARTAERRALWRLLLPILSRCTARRRAAFASTA